MRRGWDRSYDLIFKDYSSYDTNNLKQVINDMCDISNCDGIIVQLPIPDKFDVEELQNAIPAEKDVDGFREILCSFHALQKV